MGPGCFQLSSWSPVTKALSLDNPCENRIMKCKNVPSEICIQKLLQIRITLLIWVYTNILRKITLEF